MPHQNSSLFVSIVHSPIILTKGSMYQMWYFLDKRPLYAPSNFIIAYLPRHRHLLPPFHLLILKWSAFRQPYHRSSHFFAERQCFIPSHSVTCFQNICSLILMHTRNSSFRGFHSCM